jgi:acylphosphatase
MKAVRHIVKGIVQGVGFRYYVVQQATRLGLTGYVKNQPDMSVEVYLEGPEDACDQMKRLLQTGPPSARVREIETEPRTPTNQWNSFHVEY